MRNLATLARFEQAERLLDTLTVRGRIRYVMDVLVQETGSVETARLVVKAALCGFVGAYKGSAEED